jgi:hypothetical protein
MNAKRKGKSLLAKATCISTSSTAHVSILTNLSIQPQTVVDRFPSKHLLAVL